MNGRFWGLFSLTLFFMVLVSFFYPVVFGRIPFPADALLGMYHPFRDVVWDGLTRVPAKNPLTTDPILQTYPWRELAMSEIKDSRLPLWNSYTFSGTPLLANIQTAVLNPLNVLFLILPFPVGWTVLILLQPLLGGLFFFLYTRALRIHPLAAVFGATAWVLGGFFLGWMTWGTIGFVALWLPLLLWCVETFRKKRAFWIALIFLAGFTSQLVSGHLQTSFYLSVLVIVYIFFRFSKVLLGLIVVSVLIASVQLLPTLELLSLSARGEDLVGQPSGFLPWKHLVQFFAPDFFGNPVTQNYFGDWNYLEFVGYIGILPILFALVALRQWGWHVRFFTSVAGISLFLALPNPISALIFRVLFFGTAAPARLLFLIDFSLAILATIGLNQLFRVTVNKRIYVRLLSCVFFIFVILWGIAFRFDFSVSQRNLILPTVVFLVGGFFGWIAIVRLRFLAVAAVVLVLINAADLLRFAHKFTPFAPVTWVYPQTKILDYLQQDQSEFRIMADDRRILPPNVSMIYRLQSIEGYDPIYLRSYGVYIAGMEQGRDEHLSLAFGRILTPMPVLNEKFGALGVKYRLSLSDLEDPMWELTLREGETRLYRNVGFSGVSFQNQGAYRRFVEEPVSLKVGLMLSVLGLVGGVVIVTKTR